MSEPRIIPPAEARTLLRAHDEGHPFLDRSGYFRLLAHTAAVLGEQREAVLAVIDGIDFGFPETARMLREALGVTDA